MVEKREIYKKCFLCVKIIILGEKMILVKKKYRKILKFNIFIDWIKQKNTKLYFNLA